MLSLVGTTTFLSRLPIVTMSMEELPVAVEVVSTEFQWHDVIDFGLILRPEEQSTPGTTALLSSYEYCHASRQDLVLAEASTTVNPVAVIWAFISLDLRMASDGRAVMIEQSRPVPIPEDPRPTLLGLPIPIGDPVAGLTMMAKQRPAAKLNVEQVIHLGEFVLGDHLRVVVSPPTNDRVQFRYQDGLSCDPEVSNHISKIIKMPAQRFRAGCDDGLETQQISFLGLSSQTPGVCLAHGVLTYPEAKEVEAAPPVLGAKRMNDLRFCGIQFEAHSGQPSGCNLLDLNDDCLVLVQHHEIVRVAHHEWLPVTLSLAALAECGANVCFEAVQRDVGKQRRDHTTLRCSLIGGEQSLPIHDAGAEPSADN